MALMPTRRLRKGKRPPRWLYPSRLESEYVRWLGRIWETALRETLEKRVSWRVPLMVAQADETRPHRTDSMRTDGWPDEVDLMRDKISEDLAGIIPAVRRRATSIAVDLYQHNRRQWRKIQIAMLGVEAVGQNESWAGDMLDAWIHGNVGLIKKLNQEAASNIEGIVTRGIQTGLRHEEIMTQIVGRLPDRESRKTKNRAKLIARDQVAKLNGQITQARQTELGVTRYVWRTSDDDRVRESHLVLDDMTCRWDDPTVVQTEAGEWIKRSSLDPVAGYEGQPGIDYQCRCVPEPILSDVVEGLEL